MFQLREHYVETVFADLEFVEALKPREEHPPTQRTPLPQLIEQPTG